MWWLNGRAASFKSRGPGLKPPAIHFLRDSALSVSILMKHIIAGQIESSKIVPTPFTKSKYKTEAGMCERRDHEK